MYREYAVCFAELLTSGLFVQEWNFTAAIVGAKGIEATTALNFATAWQTDGLSAGYVGREDITEEPVQSQRQPVQQPWPLVGIIVAGYVAKAGIIAEHAIVETK